MYGSDEHIINTNTIQIQIRYIIFLSTSLSQWLSD